MDSPVDMDGVCAQEHSPEDMINLIVQVDEGVAQMANQEEPRTDTGSPIAINDEEGVRLLVICATMTKFSNICLNFKIKFFEQNLLLGFPCRTCPKGQRRAVVCFNFGFTTQPANVNPTGDDKWKKGGKPKPRDTALWEAARGVKPIGMMVF